MSKSKYKPTQRIGQLLLLALTALILIRMTFRDPQGGDALFWLVRWPFWLLVVGVLPLILIRVLLWNRINWTEHRKEPKSDGSSKTDEPGFHQS